MMTMHDFDRGARARQIKESLIAFAREEPVMLGLFGLAALAGVVEAAGPGVMLGLLVALAGVAAFALVLSSDGSQARS